MDSQKEEEMSATTLRDLVTRLEAERDQLPLEAYEERAELNRTIYQLKQGIGSPRREAIYA